MPAVEAMRQSALNCHLLLKLMVLAALPVSMETRAGAPANLCQSNGNGNWNVAGTWTCGRVPLATDDVQIRNGHDVTIPAGHAAVALSVTLLQNNGTNRLIHAAANSTLTVGAGGVTINASNNNNVNDWNIGAGSATVNGGVTLVQGGNNNRRAYLQISSGVLTVNGTVGNNGDITMTNNANALRTQIIFSGAGSVSLTRSFILNGGFGTLTSAAGSTFTYNSGSAATVATGGSISYRDLIINKAAGSATAATTGNLAVTGSLDVQAGTLSIGATAVTVTGTTGISGMLEITSAIGAKRFDGDVTINGSGVWNNSGDAAINFRGSLTNNGAFVSGTGTYTFSNTAAREWAGSSGLVFAGSVAVNAARTNNTTTTITGNLTGSSTLTNASDQTLNIGGNASGLSTLNAAADGNVVNYNGTSAQVAKTATYHHLTVSNTAGPVTLSGNVSIRGDLVNDGNFDPASGNRTATFNGGSAQTISGSATVDVTATNQTTFYRITLNNANGLTLSGAHDVTVTNRATLTDGAVTTGANVLYISNGSAISGAGGGKFVIGNLRKAYTTGGNVTRLFEVGSGTSYGRVDIRFGSVTTAGDFTVSAIAGDHPEILSSTLDPDRSVNRHWRLTRDSVVFANHGNNRIIFRFENPDDVDQGPPPADTGAFLVGRYNAPDWTEIMPSATAAASTTISGADVNAADIGGEFQIAEQAVAPPPSGSYNLVDPGDPIAGLIRTKVAGAPIVLDLLRLNATGTALLGLPGKKPLTVGLEVVDSSDDSGMLDSTTGCRASWTTVIATLPDYTMVGGDGRYVLPAFEIAEAYRNVRIRVTEPAGGTVRACSSDNFAIRPDAFISFSVSDTDWENAGTGRALNDTTLGAVTHKAGRPFSVRAVAVNAAGMPVTTTNYAGTPAAEVGACAGAACTVTFGALDLDAEFAAGQLVADTATYSEVGAFRLRLVDSDFASVDSGDGSTADEREIRSTHINVGRFVPDHFLIARNTPQFEAACTAGGFTYVGQRFGYAAGLRPVISVTARNADNNPTTLYAGSLWRIADSALTGKAYSADTGAAAVNLDTSAIDSPDPEITPTGPGQGTLAFNSGTDGFFFERGAPVPPFAAEIALEINVADLDGVASLVDAATSLPLANPVRFGAASSGSGIPFAGGKTMRWGRLRIGSGSGSNLVPLNLRMEAQYWQEPAPGKGFFSTHTADSCTVVATGNVGLGNFRNLASGDSMATVDGMPFTGGLKSLVLSPPGGAKTGTLDVVVHLGAAADPVNTCVSFTTPSTPAGAELSHLRSDRGCAATAAHDGDPVARVRFGSYRGADALIFMRENF